MDFLLVFLMFLTTTSVLVVPSLGKQFCQRRVCCFFADAQWRPTPESRFLPADIDASLCSHIIYQFAYMTANGLRAAYATDETTDAGIGSYDEVTRLKINNPDLKVLLSVYVKPTKWEDFITVTNTESSLSEFSKNVIEFLRSRFFDGLDFHFAILGILNTSPDIRNRISKVLQHLRRAFDEEKSDNDKLLLTAAVFGEKVLDHKSFHVQVISENVDWINLLAVDLNGPWREVGTGHHSPLYPDTTNTESWDTLYNVDKAVKHWIDGGTPKDKIVLALPFYGTAFRLTSSDTGVGAPTKDDVRGQLTGKNDFLTYFEICDLRNRGPYDRVYLKEQGATYIVFGDVWISYDDINIVRQKVRYIKENGLGGFAAYSVDEDDVLGHFCGSGPFPLLRAANLECTL